MLIHSLNSLKPPMNKCDGWMDLPSFSFLNITEYMVYFCPQIYQNFTAVTEKIIFNSYIFFRSTRNIGILS